MNNETQLSPEQTLMTDRRIPVTLLTGFLGAGKTTLLNNLLQHPAMVGAAVLINEFGEVGIDHHLVERVDETILILDSGCICCSVQGDLVKALRNLGERCSKREIPEVTRVVIETTGLADPVPVIYTLTQERFVAARYRCDGVVTAVAATHALKQLDRHREAVRQVTMADRLLITKCDLADPTCRTLLEGRLDLLNPGAARLEVQQGRIGPDDLFGCGIYANGDRSAKVAAWLGAEQIGATRSPAAGIGTPSVLRGKAIRASHAAARLKTRHDDSVSSFVIDFATPVHWYEFAVAMGRILQTHGPKILRVKGLMNIAGDPLPRVIHCVQDVAYPPVSLTGWPQQSPFEDRRGRLVFIVCDLTGEEVATIRGALSGAQQKTASSRRIMAACPVPTRCWLFHDVSRGGSSAFRVDGWDVQPIRMRAK